MAIYKHPDGTYHRYPYSGSEQKKAGEVVDHADDSAWTQVPGSPQGVEIHRDGKTMRNRQPFPKG